MPRLQINPTKYMRADSGTLLSKVLEVVDGAVRESKVLSDHDDTKIPTFYVDELTQGRVLGRGGFCVVREIDEINLRSPTGKNKGFQGIPSNVTTTQRADVDNADGGLDDDLFDEGNRSSQSSSSSKSSRKKQIQFLKRTSLSNFGGSFGKFTRKSSPSSGKYHLNDHSDESTREYIARRVWAKTGSKYVVKQVDPNLLRSNKVLLLKGTIDLILEAKYLSELQHPHIMQVRGLCRSDANEPDQICNYFIVLEELNEILTIRLNKWMHVYRATRGITGFVTRGKRRAIHLMLERLLVAHDIAEAMDYLHSKNIIYRDLKPDNIGFTCDGVLKVFDFGLARELPDNDRVEDGLYNMTGLTGAVRYMAPEVGLNERYNLKADVYSWSMLFFYILALEPPMGSYTPNMFMDRVFERNYRPSVQNKDWSPSVVRLLQRSWRKEIEARPSFNDILRVLRTEIKNVDPNIGRIMGPSFDDTSAYDTQTDVTGGSSRS